MNACPACHQQNCSEVIDFGTLPICHHFLTEDQSAESHSAILGQCPTCGLVQMMDPIPPAKLIPRFDWISYNEPEAHLDAMVAMLAALPDMTPQSQIAGVTYKEDTTLRRFRERGFSKTWRMDTQRDLEIFDPRAGIETVQSRIEPSRVSKLRSRYGTPDLIIVRHTLEHTLATATFLETFRQLVKPEGYVVFEVPDCARAFDLLDYTTLWEDHSLYFTESTFCHLVANHGFKIIKFERYRAAYENCLVVVAQPLTEVQIKLPEPTHLELLRAQARRFAAEFLPRRQAVRNKLLEWSRQGAIAMFGAGHQSAMFINLMEVADLVEFVVDDHPGKCGLRMPGSALPIVGSNRLNPREIKLCLSSLGVESEQKVIAKHAAYLREGGVFASIFPVRPDTVLNYLARGVIRNDS